MIGWFADFPSLLLFFSNKKLLLSEKIIILLFIKLNMLSRSKKLKENRSRHPRLKQRQSLSICGL